MKRMPSIFVSHGAPTFALEPGAAGATLAALGRTLPRPRAIVVVSPHWMTRGLAVTAAALPATIHDFGGFPRALYALRYAAPGDPALARDIAGRLSADGEQAMLDGTRGLDHGAWVPLMHLYPAADIPVLQVSLPVACDAAGAWRLGERLAPLADEGVLLVGSGSLTHNLYDIRFGDTAVEPYAREFAHWVRAAALAGDADAVRATLERAPPAARAHPTSEHVLPLLVAAGAAPAGAAVQLIDGGIEHAVLSMDGFVFGDVPGGKPQAAA